MYKRLFLIIKRVLDLVVAVLSLILLLIPFMIIAILIKKGSHGPVLFKQQRYGKNRKIFTIYKFRTMYTTAPSNMPTAEMENPEEHVIPGIGNFLRKTSIDELPQLFNIVLGHMSFIGPRPVILEETKLIDLREQYGANGVLPGISGWAQVNGRDTISDEEKARLDGEYVKRMSFLFDLKCIYLTVVNVSSSKDIKG